MVNKSKKKVQQMNKLYENLLNISSDIGCAGLHLPEITDVPEAFQPDVEEIARLVAALQKRLYTAQAAILKVAYPVES